MFTFIVLTGQNPFHNMNRKLFTLDKHVYCYHVQFVMQTIFLSFWATFSRSSIGLETELTVFLLTFNDHLHGMEVQVSLLPPLHCPIHIHSLVLSRLSSSRLLSRPPVFLLLIETEELTTTPIAQAFTFYNTAILFQSLVRFLHRPSL